MNRHPITCGNYPNLRFQEGEVCNWCGKGEPEPVILGLEETIYRALYKHREKDSITLAMELTDVVSLWNHNAQNGTMETR